MIKRSIALLLIVAATACTNKATDLKSPCVGIAGSPCEHRPVNDWWRS